MCIIPCLDKHKSLEQFNLAFSRCGSFRKTMHAISKQLILEDRDGGYWEDPYPDTTTSACFATATSSYEGPPYHNNIEWANTAGDNAMRASGFHFLSNLGKASQHVLCGMNTRFYCLACFNNNKPNQVMPLC